MRKTGVVSGLCRSLGNWRSSPGWKVGRGLLIGVCVSIVVIILHHFSLLETFELKTLDWRFRTLTSPHAASSEIVIVEVNQRSIDYYEEMEALPWPWPRGLYQAAIDFVNFGGAKAVVLDILFTERSGYGYEDDAYFGDVVRDAGNVYLPISVSREEREMEPDVDRYLMSETALKVKDESHIDWVSYRSVVLPVSELVRSARGLGNVMMTPDDDGIYRRVPLVSAYGGNFLPSLPLAVSMDLLDVEVISVDASKRLHMDGISVPLREDGSMLVKYHSGARTYRYYSIAGVIQSFVNLEEGEEPIVDPEEFRNKVVLVGLTAPGLFDLKPSPFSSVYPGVEVHATVIDNILHEDFLIRSGTRTLLLVVLGLSCVCGMAVSYSVRLRVSLPLAGLCAGVPLILSATGFKGGLWLEVVAPEVGVLATFGLTSIISYSTEGRQRRFIKNAFTHYLNPLVIDELLKDPEKLKLGGERRELTVFFSDVAGFTSLSEKLPPEELSLLLSRYLTCMTDVILKHGGTLDKYEGDAIMAFWGAPLTQHDHAQRACVAALECHAELQNLQEEFSERGWPPLDARIGINSGEMVVGNMGSRNRFDYTVLGDEVNLGSRLEGANKEYGTHIMISERTYHLARASVETRELDMLKVKGKQVPVRVYEVLAKSGELGEERARVRKLFGEGLSLYRERRWQEAIEVLKRLSEDPPSRVFLGRCTELSKSPPQDWDGVYTMRTK